MELECSKLKFQGTKCPTSCNFLFFPSHITQSHTHTHSLSFSPSLQSLSLTQYCRFSLSLSSLTLTRLPQSLVSLNASSLHLFYLLCHHVIPYLLLNGRRLVDGGDKRRHSIRKQGKHDLFLPYLFVKFRYGFVVNMFWVMNNLFRFFEEFF